MIKASLFSMVLTTLITLSACKKNKPDVVATTPPVTTPGSSNTTTSVDPELLKDSSLFYSRDIYLWNTQIPSTFNARSYADPAGVMTAIRAFSVEPSFAQPVDKWSFAMKKTEWDQMSGGMATLATGSENQGDFGMYVFFRAEGDLRVRLVEPNSPAGAMGIRRGWRITEINGSTSITTANSTSIINNVYYSTSTSFLFTLPDGTTVAKTINAGHYAEKPVYKDTVYNLGSKRIGYLVYNSFLGKAATINAEFQRVFNHFTASQVTDLIIDLRYNGGGYVSLAESLANYLAPSSANGGLMMSQIYNSQNTANNRNSYFVKKGSLELPVIYFLVTRSSASASELLINTLKPYVDVRLIGPSATHGKPVGYFPISVGDWYVFPVSFRTTNKNGEGNYFSGIPVNAAKADGLDKDWGDPEENMLASALKNITGGTYGRGVLLEEALPTQAVTKSNSQLDEPFLKVTIGERPR